MHAVQKNYAEWTLRLGLGIMFLYSGFDILMHPTAWHWAVRGLPIVIQDTINVVGIDTYLKFQGISELVIAFVFLGWFLPRGITVVAVLAATMEITLILLFVRVNYITFRDIGLLGATLSLLALVYYQPSSEEM